MRRPDWDGPLGRAATHARDLLGSLPDRAVRPDAGAEELRAALGGPLPDDPVPAHEVIDHLAAAGAPGVMATQSGRFFGFVIGGTTPAALAADWLVSAWDQNAGLFAASPVASVVEEVATGWLRDLLALPRDASAGFVTGGQMANLTCLAAARHHVLERVGWDVEERGLQGAPGVRVIAGAEAHDTIPRATRFLGLGSACIERVPVDDQGRMRPEGLADQLEAGDGPVIVCAQAGNVNTGSFDPLEEICAIAHGHDAWVHVDGAFGLWAAASPRRRHLVRGHDLADSWATDAHKWLNVPYDSGLAFTAHPSSHRAAMAVRAAYLIQAAGAERDQMDWNPEFSRRARGLPVYAVLRSLGRSGLAELVDRCCDLAERFAAGLRRHDGIEVVNDVVLNQVLVRFTTPGGDHDGRTREVVRRVQEEGTAWMSGTTWQGRAAMRISVSNWSTDEDDVDRSIDAILRCVAAADAAG